MALRAVAQVGTHVCCRRPVGALAWRQRVEGLVRLEVGWFHLLAVHTCVLGLAQVLGRASASLL